MEPAALSPESIELQELGILVDGYWTIEEKARSPFGPSRIGRWRRTLPPLPKALGTLLMRGRLQRLGYSVGTRRGFRFRSGSH